MDIFVSKQMTASTDLSSDTSMVFQIQKQIPNCNYKYRTKTLDFFKQKRAEAICRK